MSTKQSTQSIYVRPMTWPYRHIHPHTGVPCEPVAMPCNVTSILVHLHLHLRQQKREILSYRHFAAPSTKDKQNPAVAFRNRII